MIDNWEHPAEEFRAESLYETAVEGIALSAGVYSPKCRSGRPRELTIRVKGPEEEHTITVAKLLSWLDGVTTSPAEKLKKRAAEDMSPSAVRLRNNTYIEQLQTDAQAAIDKAVEMGVADRERIGVFGHSYGAFMTANLLAHTKLFRAAVAESGAYNRTLTPFGFQTESRTFWEAPDVYTKMSPFWFADKIKTPVLLIHGEADDNTGTYPIQSERMYAAIRGNGGTVRLVMLPAEAHGYRAIETIEHVLYEELTWFDKYLR